MCGKTSKTFEAVIILKHGSNDYSLSAVNLTEEEIALHSSDGGSVRGTLLDILKELINNVSEMEQMEGENGR